MATDVLILGGGVIGLTTAYFLAREGVNVTVIDKGDFGQEASWAGAGILPPGNPARARSPVDRLRAESSARFPALSAELRDRTGIDNGYLRCGGLEFFGKGDDLAEDEWCGEGVACERIDEEACRRMEPTLAPGLGDANSLPELAQLRNPRHLQALLAACESVGVRLHAGWLAHAFEMRGQRVLAVATNTGLMSANRFLVAAGAWSDALLGSLGWRPGIRPIRGQIALLNTGVAKFRRVLMLGSRYLVPRADGRVLTGSTEEDVGFVKRTTADAIQSLVSFAISLVPGLAEAELERCWAGLRPGSPDGLPFLGPVPGYDNCFVAAGHFRAGIQLSPGSALLMKELLLGQEPTVRWEPFRLDRGTSRQAQSHSGER